MGKSSKVTWKIKLIYYIYIYIYLFLLTTFQTDMSSCTRNRHSLFRPQRGKSTTCCHLQPYGWVGIATRLAENLVVDLLDSSVLCRSDDISHGAILELSAVAAP